MRLLYSVREEQTCLMLWKNWMLVDQSCWEFQQGASNVPAELLHDEIQPTARELRKNTRALGVSRRDKVLQQLLQNCLSSLATAGNTAAATAEDIPELGSPLATSWTMKVVSNPARRLTPDGMTPRGRGFGDRAAELRHLNLIFGLLVPSDAGAGAVSDRLVTSLPTISNTGGEHIAVGRLVHLGALQRAGPEFEIKVAV
ncbi:hypothetical protein C8R45DRAFT_1171353 [Mycena sanguinolenta]|nr:hypothetical protein C8R45DRAFT_1171353 [Mycena sanguinolenta]